MQQVLRPKQDAPPRVCVVLLKITYSAEGLSQFPVSGDFICLINHPASNQIVDTFCNMAMKFREARSSPQIPTWVRNMLSNVLSPKGYVSQNWPPPPLC